MGLATQSNAASALKNLADEPSLPANQKYNPVKYSWEEIFAYVWQHERGVRQK